jgi:hypothetical protein
MLKNGRSLLFLLFSANKFYRFFDHFSTFFNSSSESLTHKLDMMNVIKGDTTWMHRKNMNIGEEEKE